MFQFVLTNVNHECLLVIGPLLTHLTHWGGRAPRPREYYFTMADNRKYDSGAQKRKKRKEKEHRAKEATNKMPKLTGFFKPVSGDGAETSLSPAPQTLSYNTGTKIPPEPLTVTESVAGLASVESELVEAGSSSADGKTTVDPYSTDPAHWGEIDESVRAYWAERGPESCQNMNVGFQASERVYKHQKRHFSKSHFKRKMLNGEYIERPWLLYSPSTGAAFCFACRIFTNANTQSNFETGFSDWKHATERMREHENSEHHRKAMLTYVSLAAASGRIDTELQKQFESECSYWTEVLRRVVSVVKFLAERGLALRGASDKFGRTDNGNYLGILELISEFDPFLKSHIEKYGNAGSGKPSYLSSQTCEEFIQLMGDRVLSEIVSEVKMAKYFSVSVDSTPDVAHVDQLTFVLRYVSPEGHSQERFLKFLPIESHTGEALCASVLKVLEEMGIDIANCRGQCYDNAANMSGVYKGLQARIKELNPLVEWVPCAAHTLNLVGVNSVNCCFETADFFQFVQNLFNFCSKSTARWKVVTDGLQPNANKRIETLKSLSNTRWAAHADATQAVHINYANIQKSLKNIVNDTNQNAAIRNEARSLDKKMDKLETAFMCTFWHSILQRFEKASAALQSVELDLCTAVDLVGSLREYIGGLRDQFDRFESQAKKLSPTVSQAYRVTGRRSKTPKPFFGESATSEVDLSAQQKFSTSVFLVVVDRLLSEINRRYIAYDNLNNTFGFLNNISGVTVPELRNKASHLQSKYSADLEMDFVEEIVQFKDFIRDKGITSARLLLQFIREKKLQDIFPNVDIAFRLYLTFPVTNASGERSFSKLKIVKNRLRSTMGQERLNHLTLMSIESDLVRKLDFSDLVKEFAVKKSRKVGNFSNFISD